MRSLCVRGWGRARAHRRQAAVFTRSAVDPTLVPRRPTQSTAPIQVRACGEPGVEEFAGERLQTRRTDCTDMWRRTCDGRTFFQRPPSNVDLSELTNEVMTQLPAGKVIKVKELDRSVMTLEWRNNQYVRGC